MLTCKATFSQVQGQQTISIAQPCIHVANQAAFQHGLLGSGGGE